MSNIVKDHTSEVYYSPSMDAFMLHCDEALACWGEDYHPFSALDASESGWVHIGEFYTPKENDTKRGAEMKPVKVKIDTIEFGAYAHLLWSYASECFIDNTEQQGRFHFMEGHKSIKKVYMYGCDSYLNAKIFAAYLEKRDGAKTAIYGDEYAESDYGNCVVVSNQMDPDFGVES